jgi:hypothetical protein
MPGEVVGEIAVAATIDLGDFESKLEAINNGLASIGKSVEVLLKVNSTIPPKERQNLQRMALEAAKKAPAQLPVGFALDTKATENLQGQLDKAAMAASVTSLTLGTNAIENLQRLLDDAKLKASISDFSIDPEKLASKIQEALNSHTFKVTLQVEGLQVQGGGGTGGVSLSGPIAISGGGGKATGGKKAQKGRTQAAAAITPPVPSAPPVSPQEAEVLRLIETVNEAIESNAKEIEKKKQEVTRLREQVERADRIDYTSRQRRPTARARNIPEILRIPPHPSGPPGTIPRAGWVEGARAMTPEMRTFMQQEWGMPTDYRRAWTIRTPEALAIQQQLQPNWLAERPEPRELQLFRMMQGQRAHEAGPVLGGRAGFREGTEPFPFDPGSRFNAGNISGTPTSAYAPDIAAILGGRAPRIRSLPETAWVRETALFGRFKGRIRAPKELGAMPEGGYDEANRKRLDAWATEQWKAAQQALGIDEASRPVRPELPEGTPRAIESAELDKWMRANEAFEARRSMYNYRVMPGRGGRSPYFEVRRRTRRDPESLAAAQREYEAKLLEPWRGAAEANPNIAPWTRINPETGEEEAFTAAEYFGPNATLEERLKFGQGAAKLERRLGQLSMDTGYRWSTDLQGRTRLTQEAKPAVWDEEYVNRMMADIAGPARGTRQPGQGKVENVRFTQARARQKLIDDRLALKKRVGPENWGRFVGRLRRKMEQVPGSRSIGETMGRIMSGEFGMEGIVYPEALQQLGITINQNEADFLTNEGLIGEWYSRWGETGPGSDRDTGPNALRPSWASSRGVKPGSSRRAFEENERRFGERVARGTVPTPRQARRVAAEKRARISGSMTPRGYESRVVKPARALVDEWGSASAVLDAIRAGKPVKATSNVKRWLRAEKGIEQAQYGAELGASRELGIGYRIQGPRELITEEGVINPFDEAAAMRQARREAFAGGTEAGIQKRRELYEGARGTASEALRERLRGLRRRAGEIEAPFKAQFQEIAEPTEEQRAAYHGFVEEEMTRQMPAEDIETLRRYAGMEAGEKAAARHRRGQRKAKGDPNRQAIERIKSTIAINNTRIRELEQRGEEARSRAEQLDATSVPMRRKWLTDQLSYFDERAKERLEERWTEKEIRDRVANEVRNDVYWARNAKKTGFNYRRRFAVKWDVKARLKELAPLVGKPKVSPEQIAAERETYLRAREAQGPAAFYAGSQYEPDIAELRAQNEELQPTLDRLQATEREQRAERVRKAMPTTLGGEVEPEKIRYERKKKGQTWAFWEGGPQMGRRVTNAEEMAVAEQYMGIKAGAATGGPGEPKPPKTGKMPGGGEGVVNVHVTNFDELNKLLTNTTQPGSLFKVMKGSGFSGHTNEPIETSVEAVMKKYGYATEEEVGAAAVSGELGKRIEADEKAKAAEEEKAKTSGAPAVAAAAPKYPKITMLPSGPITSSGVSMLPPDFKAATTARGAAETSGIDRMWRAEVRRMKAEMEPEVTQAKGEEKVRARAAKEAADEKKKADADAKKKTKAAGEPKPKPTAQEQYEEAIRKLDLETEPRQERGGPSSRAVAEAQVQEQLGKFAYARQMMPERAPGVAFAQIFARLTGVKPRMERALEARTEAYNALVTAKEQTNLEEKRLDLAVQNREAIKAQYKESSDAYKVANQEVERLTKSTEERAAAEKTATERLKETDDAFSKASGRMASFMQVGGLFVGVKAFTMFSAAIDKGMALVMDATGRAADQSLHFQATNDKVTKSLRDQVTALHGNTQAALAQQSVMAGLSDEAAKFIGANVMPSAQAMAGSRANMAASDMWRAASYASRGTGKYMGYPSNLFEGQGGILGGALLAEQMGGTPGVLQRVSDDITAFTADITNLNPAPEMEQYIANLEAQLTPTPIREGYTSEQQYQGAVRAVEAQNRPIQNEINAYRDQIAGIKVSTEVADKLSASEKVRTKYIDDLNATTRRGAYHMGMLDSATSQTAVSFKEFGTKLDDVDKDVRAAMVAAGERLGGEAPALLDKMMRAGVGVEGLTGKTPAEQARLVAELVQQFATGRTYVDEQQFINLTKQQLTAQLEGNEMMARFQRNVALPAQGALQRLMEPPVPVEAGLAPLIAEVPTGGKALTVQAARVQALQTAEQQAYGKTIAEQQQTVLNMISPADQPAARGLLDTLTSIGQEMARISAESARISANLTAAQYHNQRRIMLRDYNDALALAGRVADAEKGRLGVLNREQVLLERQNQALSLQAQQISIQLSQRQINFQVAIAGFQAPGVTAEERAARIEQAKIEAAYAQKQLDIQKEQAKIAGKQYRLGIKIFDVTVERQITDLRKGLELLDKSYVANIQIALNEKELAVLDKKRQRVANQLNSYIEQNMANQNAIVSAAITASATVMGSVNKWYVAIASNFQNMVKIYWQALTNPTGQTNEQRSNYRGIEAKASGALFNTTGAQTMTVGEAGTETVAILSNPREVMATPMGGTGTTVVINVTGNSVRDDRDIDLLVDRIERKLNLKASLLGFRRPV